MIPFSILDLSPVPMGSTVGVALRNTIDLARNAEGWGYHRYWLAEHHSLPGVASAATSIVIAQVAAATSAMRVGAGGIMLPNHAPLVIAEQFGTLESLFPGRIDLGLGRAPGADQATARALRRNLASNPDEFPQDVMELIQYFAPVEPGQRIVAVPGAGLKVPLWILGSSLFGAQVAAALGLPFAFASHFAPAAMMDAIAIYRQRFRASAQLQRPYVMLGFNVFAADSDEEARFLATSMQQAFVNLRSGQPTQLPPPVAGYAEQLPDSAKALLADVLSCSAIGSPATVDRAVRDFMRRTHPDELMLTSQMFDHAARLRSFELAATCLRNLTAPR
jgi:luciferase family oxidoreductase group 1